MAGVLSPTPPARHRRVHPGAAARPDHDPLPGDASGVLDGTRPRRRRLVLSADIRARPATTAGPSWTSRLGHAAGQPGPDRRRRRRAGRRAVLHPHVGTMVENRRRGAAGARGLVDLAVPGHRSPADRRHRPGRADPAGAGPDRAHPPQGRRRGMAGRCSPGGCTYTEAVRDGMYRPLGTGRRRRRGDRRAPARHGYDGWYVLEQDTILTEEPRGEGPVGDVHTSADVPAEPAHGVIAPSGHQAGQDLRGVPLAPITATAGQWCRALAASGRAGAPARAGSGRRCGPPARGPRAGPPRRRRYRRW